MTSPRSQTFLGKPRSNVAGMCAVCSVQWGGRCREIGVKVNTHSMCFIPTVFVKTQTPSYAGVGMLDPCEQ